MTERRRSRRVAAVASAVVALAALASGACNGISGIGGLHRAEDDGTCDGGPCGGDDASAGDDGGGGDDAGDCPKDCLGGACTGGVCQPAVLATGQSGPVGLAVDSTRVFWANRGDLDAGNGSVFSAWLDGGDPHEIAADQPSAGFVALDPTYVYLTAQGTEGAGFADGRIVRVKKDGTASDVLYANQTAPFGIALDGTYVYWTNALGGEVHRGDLRGQPGSSTISSAVPYAYGIAVDANGIFWARVDATDAGDIRAAPLDGSGKDSVFAAGQGGPRAVALDAANVYWVNEEDGRVMMAGRAFSGTSQPVELAKGQDGPRSIALDATYVYWANAGSSSTGTGSIARIGKDGKCPGTPCPEVLATKQSRPYGLAVDSVAVYWTNFTTGEVLRVAK